MCPPCGDAFRQPPACMPPYSFKDPDIPPDDGLLDPGDLALSFLVDFRRTGIPSPVGEHPARPEVLLPSLDNRHRFDLATLRHLADTLMLYLTDGSMPSQGSPLTLRSGRTENPLAVSR